MSEKLDNQQKNILASIIPEGWAYYFTLGLLVVYQELPDLEIVRKICVAGNEDKEVWVDEQCFYLTYIGKDMSHWAAGGQSLLKTKILLKGFDTLLVVSCNEFALGCKILFLVKKRIL